MPGWVFAAIVVVFVVVGVLVIRRTQKGAIVDRLPLDPGETVLLEEEGLKVFHRSRRTSVRGGGSVTHRVRSVLTNERILLATGGPEGKHKFVIVMILDYTSPSPPVGETGFAAYRQKFRLENGYPTYWISEVDAALEDDGGALRVEVPFPEGEGDRPEVKLSTSHAARYLDAIARR